MNETNVGERESNIELLRIVLMFSIILHHLVYHNYLNYLEGDNYKVAEVLGGFAKVAVNCFMLIMGFFSYRSKWNVKKIIKIVMESVFYYTIFMFIFEKNINWKAIWESLKQYWFINRICSNVHFKSSIKMVYTENS